MFWANSVLVYMPLNLGCLLNAIYRRLYSTTTNAQGLDSQTSHFVGNINIIQLKYRQPKR